MAQTNKARIILVIPVKDRRGLLTRTLDTLAAQTRLPDMLVVVDNGSTDGSLAAARDWAAAHPEVNTIVGAEPRPGASAARNAGVALAIEAGMGDDDWLMFFDSDDIMLPRHIERIAAEAEREPSTDLLYFDLAIRDSQGWTAVKSVAGDAPLMRAQIFHSALATPRFAVRHSLLRRAGGWDDELPRWNDYELGVRLILEARSPHKLCGEPTAVSLPTPGSITGSSYSKDAPTLIKALQKTRRHLAAAERMQDLRYHSARMAIVAALLAREKDMTHAEALMAAAIDTSKSRRDKLTCRLAYLSTLLAGRGGGAIASWLMAPPRPKAPGKR
ncbi:MAG: glycosyltransferase family 2 protein [Pseudoflavonifractor sp.]|nr:glycosyltransferase family 2 protein [Alloprevotella sp.]MCM1117469.1 glycosyltransferase family 2 protein [Pseudoflavonifractor sp.]